VDDTFGWAGYLMVHDSLKGVGALDGGVQDRGRRTSWVLGKRSGNY